MVFHLSQPPVRSNRMMTPDIQLLLFFLGMYVGYRYE